MNRKYRLTNSSDFQRVRRTGQSYAHPLAVLIASANNRPISRFGFSTGKALGSAVRRNRAKRLLREAIRGHLAVIEPGWDIVIIARPIIFESSWSEIQRAISDLIQRAGLFGK
ncbi:MAG: ribonuclease P protein component [Anaerolineales bacterium]|jgi:ribonuclease P protein component|nr:ribonuclease P protein component [Anaerolineales bacterium]